VSELPEGVLPAPEVRPRDSASGIVVRRAPSGGLAVLLGLRSARSRFMPGHLAFPGGGMEDADRPAEAGAWERCAAREVAEETGLAIDPGSFCPAGERVTPPIFALRFRTRFFVAELQDPALRPSPASAENEQLSLTEPRAVLEAWEQGTARLPPPVPPILRTLAAHARSSCQELARAVAATNAEEERAPRIEFLPGLWMLPVRTATLPPATHTNVWMPGRGRFVIVDPGSSDPDELDRLLAVVTRRMRAGGRPVAVMLTHHHRDHVAGAVPVARALGLPIRADERVLRGLASELSGIPAVPLVDSERLDLDGETLQVLATPGHAPGHLAFHLPERRALIAGDMVGGLSTILIDPVQGEMGDYLGSLDRLRRLDCTTLLPGHGPPLAGAAIERAIDHRQMREARILAALERPLDLEEIARGAYADAPLLPAALTRAQTLSHLLHLERAGKIRREDEAGTRWSKA
jgi:glyoxylase-like metal-dependent hydrolase (beta-lactamase superfamily II)/8-oxo-dGTP pyrophosphatase MutT (NUDIX family)